MLGILIGVSAVIAMLALGSGAKASIERQLSSMGTNLLVLRSGGRRAGGVSMQSDSARLTLSDAGAVQNEVSSVKRISRTVQGRGQVVFGNKNWNTQIQGVDPEYASMRNASPAVGRFFTAEENKGKLKAKVSGPVPSIG